MIQQEDIDRYSRLFNSIIIQAIMDAGIKPSKDEQKLEQNLLAEAVSAMDYLFGRDSNIFAHHADLVGSDADQIRELLLYRDHPVNMKNAHITPEKIRILRIRHRWHKNRSLEYV